MVKNAIKFKQFLWLKYVFAFEKNKYADPVHGNPRSDKVFDFKALFGEIELTYKTNKNSTKLITSEI